MSQPIITGSTLLDYTLRRELGQGGQGAVYYAENTETGQPAAVKFIHAEYAHNSGLRERFMREAKIMVQLSHPNICKAYHFYQDADQVAIIMEYLEGEDLQNLIDRFGPVQPLKVIEWYRQLLPAFQYAHDRGIIHRDVKPSNMVLTKKGLLKVLDFSIAKIIDGAGTDLGLTGTRTMLGTPLYMSPEQIQTPKFVDLRTDIYSLGVMMYTLLAGQAPYDAPDDSQFGLQQQIVNQPLPVLPNLPERLNRFLARATAKNRDHRYGSCTEMLRDLEAIYAPAHSIPPAIPQHLNYSNQPVDHGSQAAHIPDNKLVITWLTSPVALPIMGFVAPPAGAYLTSRNFRKLGDSSRANHWLAGSLVGVFFVLGLMQSSNSSSNTGLLMIYLAFTWFVRHTVQKHQATRLAEFKQQGGQFISGWALFGISIAYFVLMALLLIGANS